MPKSEYSLYLLRVLEKALKKLSDPTADVVMFEEFVMITNPQWITFREYYISPKTEEWANSDDDSDNE